MSKLKLRIVALCHSPEIGGAELALASLIESTKNLYEWNLVFVGTKNAPTKLSSNAYSVTYINLPWWCHEAHDKPKAIEKKILYGMLSKLRTHAESADLLLTNSITIPWLGLIAAEINKPHIWYVHEFGNIDHNLKFIFGYEQSLKTIDACSSRVLTIGSAVKEHLSRVIPEEKIDIIHQAVDLKRLVNIPAHSSNTKPMRLLCLGAIKPSKGQLVAVQATNLLNVDDPGLFTLDIIGPSANNEYVRVLQAEQNKAIRVHVQAYDPVEVLQNQDMLLMCSENEALGRVTLEGVASGRPVIGYACLATSEILGSGRGLLYKPNTPEVLAEAIKKSRDYKFDAKKNRKYVADTYSEERQSKDFVDCVTKALSVKLTLSNEDMGLYIQCLANKQLLPTGLQGKLNTTKSRIKKHTPNTIKQIARRMLKK